MIRLTGLDDRLETCLCFTRCSSPAVIGQSVSTAYTPLYHCGRMYAGQGLIIKALHASSRTLGRVERVFTGHGHGRRTDQ